uniref:Uncharacterized protein n=1 Tax=Nelumbo nucifera TaxID=4432 RepID=A0A822Z7T4_NELNU|nr:TPA_asm: hypothetical protein HUJ06_013848 [Nelumbo nucifera]
MYVLADSQVVALDWNNGLLFTRSQPYQQWIEEIVRLNRRKEDCTNRLQPYWITSYHYIICECLQTYSGLDGELIKKPGKSSCSSIMYFQRCLQATRVFRPPAVDSVSSLQHWTNASKDTIRDI